MQTFVTLKYCVERALSAECPWKAEFNGLWYYRNGTFEPAEDGTRSLSTEFGRHSIEVARTHVSYGYSGGRSLGDRLRYSVQLKDGIMEIASLEGTLGDASHTDYFSQLSDLYYRVQQACGKITWIPKTR